MREEGRITSWKDDRGFGFIAPNRGGDPVFVHVSAFVKRARRPTGNEVVSYKLARDAQGRRQARDVVFAGDPAGQLLASTSLTVRTFLVAAVFLAGLAGLVVIGRLPAAVGALYLVMSSVAFVAYGWDKSAARNGQWRTSESTLHLFGLAGGWPGALVARHVFRHKSKKASFIGVFWMTVVLNGGALIWLLTFVG